MTNKSNSNGDNFIFHKRIITKEAFAQAVKATLLASCPDCHIEIKDTSNGLNHGKLLSINNFDSSISQVIPLNSFFKEYTSGGSLPEICASIVEAYKMIRLHEDSLLESLLDYNMAEASICYRLANLSKIRKRSVPVPYIPFLDLAIVFYVPFAKDGWFTTVTITDSLMQSWGISDARKLFAVVHKNTCRYFPARMEPMASLLNDLPPEQDIPDEAKSLPLFVVSNSTRLHGASVILYEGLLKASANMLNDDLILLPSSIHEMLLLPASTCDCPEVLKEMVFYVNRTELDVDDVLSDNVYYYDRNTDNLKII